MTDPVERAKQLYLDPATGQWLADGPFEAETARDLVAEVERLRGQLAAIRSAAEEADIEQSYDMHVITDGHGGEWVAVHFWLDAVLERMSSLPTEEP